jgi:hypothetical protein
VQPRLSGDVVTLRIAPEDSSPYGGTIDRTLIATEVQARLGEWVALGGADLRGTLDGNDLLSRGQAARSSQRGVWVKVDVVE